MSSRNISDLQPEFAVLVQRLLDESTRQGLRPFITDAYRTYDEQAALYAKGRTVPGLIVTNAGPGDSWHNHRLAVDIGLLDSENRLTYNGIDMVGRIGTNLGLTWGGSWRGFQDKPHFEFHPNLSLSEAKRGVTVSEKNPDLLRQLLITTPMETHEAIQRITKMHIENFTAPRCIYIIVPGDGEYLVKNSKKQRVRDTARTQDVEYLKSVVGVYVSKEIADAIPNA